MLFLHFWRIQYISFINFNVIEGSGGIFANDRPKWKQVFGVVIYGMVFEAATSLMSLYNTAFNFVMMLWGCGSGDGNDGH